MEVFTGDKRNETSRISGVICDRRIAASVRRKGLQDGSETWCDVWFEDSDTDKNTGC